MRDDEPLSVGLRVIVAFHLLNLLLWLFGQTGAIFWYDTIAKYGFQEPRDANDPAIIQVNIGIGLADTLIALPLFAMAAVGILRRQFYGVICSWMVFYHSMYWPMVYWMSCLMYKRAGILHSPVTVTNVLLPGMMWCFGAWGSWFLCRAEKSGLRWWESELHRNYQPVRS